MKIQHTMGEAEGTPQAQATGMFTFPLGGVWAPPPAPSTYGQYV